MYPVKFSMLLDINALLSPPRSANLRYVSKKQNVRTFHVLSERCFIIGGWGVSAFCRQIIRYIWSCKTSWFLSIKTSWLNKKIAYEMSKKNSKKIWTWNCRTRGCHRRICSLSFFFCHILFCETKQYRTVNTRVDQYKRAIRVNSIRDQRRPLERWIYFEIELLISHVSAYETKIASAKCMQVWTIRTEFVRICNECEI